MLKTALVLTCGWGLAASAAPQPPAKEVTVNISSAFLPSGQDFSDPSAVISGMFPNSCYAWSRADITHVTDTLHEIRGIASVRQGMCLMVLVPFSEEVHIGKLVRGTHTLRFVNGDGTYQEKQINVDH
ncbi:MAG: hypothetical protein JST16_12555 [Bdellovibrionales bacterium]|nr:hypothetical protein [Bdellovibrionales bacterium]